MIKVMIKKYIATSVAKVQNKNLSFISNTYTLLHPVISTFI